MMSAKMPRTAAKRAPEGALSAQAGERLMKRRPRQGMLAALQESSEEMPTQAAEAERDEGESSDGSCWMSSMQRNLRGGMRLRRADR